jgi:hypothetical protein
VIRGAELIAGAERHEWETILMLTRLTTKNANAPAWLQCTRLYEKLNRLNVCPNLCLVKLEP